MGSELQIGSSYTVESTSTLTAGKSHALTEYTLPQHITIAKYTDVLIAEGYEELMLYSGRPVMLLRDTPESRVVVWAFDLNYSNLIALPDFSVLIYNMFNYFIFETFTGSTFEVGETVKLRGRGDGLLVTGADGEVRIEGGEGEITPARPGTYTVTQTAGGEIAEESFFVRIPTEESSISRTVEVLPFTAAESEGALGYEDLILYFAIALVSLMFADWILEIKKNY